MSRAETLTMPLRVDGEGDLDLRHAARRRRDADQLELAERAVLARDLALALQAVDLAPCPGCRTTVVKICVALVGIVELRSISLVKRPPWVSMPSDRRVTSSEHDVLDVALQDAALDGGADRHHLRRG
jgi:hypothetical protein